MGNLPSRRIELELRLDDSPRYRGSIHDDAVARAHGYRAALVPGAFLYGHFSRVAVETWGLEWIERGALAARFRRPAYNGDRVTIEVDPEAGTDRIALALRDPDDEIAADGWISPPVTRAEPDPSDWPILPLPDPRPAIAPGGMRAGMRASTAGIVLAQADIAESLAAFDERHPIYAREGIAHPGFAMRHAMGEVARSFGWPGPMVLTACEGRHFALVKAGQKLETSGVAAECFEKRGKHYVVTEEVLLADGRPAALFRRTQIYAQAAA